MIARDSRLDPIRTRSLGVRALLVLLVLAVAAPACDGTAGLELVPLGREIEDRREQWGLRPFRDYTYRLQRNCFCLPETRGPVRVEVRTGEAVQVTYLESGEPVDEDFRQHFPTIDGLFDVLVDAVIRGADDVNVEWHPTLGFPTAFWIDYDARTADEEVGFEVNALEPLE